MRLEFLDRQLFDFLIYFVFTTGVIAAVIRLYRDFTRPLPADKHPDDDTHERIDDTRPRPPSA